VGSRIILFNIRVNLERKVLLAFFIKVIWERTRKRVFSCDFGENESTEKSNE